jgi:TrmH family RNA methyltransferase
MGAIFHVPVERDVSVESLCSRYKKLALLGLDGKPVSTPQFKTFDGYVFGNEARGLPREVSEQLGGESFSIPGEKNIESLNLASAVNICAYELTRS